MKKCSTLENSLVLFAASKDQKRYFDALAVNTELNVRVVWYKHLKGVALSSCIPFSALWKQANILTKRKRNSRKGKSFPAIYWPFFNFFAWLHALLIFAQSTYFFRHESALFVGVWNGKKFRQAIFVEAAYHFGRQPVFFETGPMPGYSCIDFAGVNAHSSIPRVPDFYKNYLEISDVSLDKNTCLESFRTVNMLPKQYVFVPFQVVEDSNIYLHSPWVHTMRQLFEMFERASEYLSSKGIERYFIFKPHPACDEDYSDLKVRQNQFLKIVDDLDTSQLVACAEAIVTINSTVGIEGLKSGKKVLVLGEALFNIPELVFPIKSEKSLFDHLETLDSLNVDEDLIVRFFNYLSKDYAIPGDAMKAPSSLHWQSVEDKLQRMMMQKNTSTKE